MLPNYLLYYGTEKLTSVHTGLYLICNRWPRPYWASTATK